jgi:uncharacterized membrane protein
MQLSKLNFKKETIIFAVILIVAFFLRLYRLGFHDLWYDEVYSVIISKKFWQDWNPPFYFALLNYWIRIFGTSEFSLRLPSLIFSVAGIPFIFLLGKHLFNEKVGISASLIMSLSPFHLWYAQEARPYSLSILLGLVSTYFLYRALIEEKVKFWFYFVLFSVLGVYSNISHFHFILLVGQIVSTALFIKKKLWLKVLCFLLVLFFSIPYLPKFIAKLEYIKAGFWPPEPTFKSLVITFENFNLGYNTAFPVYLISNLLAGFFLVRAFFAIKKNKQWRKNFSFVLILFVLPIALIYIVSKILVPVYIDRGLIIFSPYYYLILALGIESVYNRRIKGFVIISSFLLLLVGIYGYYQDWMFTSFEHTKGAYIKKPFKPTVRFIESNFKIGDIVAHTNYSSQIPFKFYTQRKEIFQNFLFAPGMIDTNWQRPYYSGGTNICVKDVNLTQGSRIWVIFSEWSRKGNLDNNARGVKKELDSWYKSDLSLEFDGLWIFRYVKR